MKNLSREFCVNLLILLALVTVGLVPAILAAPEKSPDGLWERTSKDNLKTESSKRALPDKYLVYRLNRALFDFIKQDAPLEFTDEANQKRVILHLPNPDGKMVSFYLEESPVLSPDVAWQFPDWQTFSGQGIDDPTAVARFSWTVEGFRGYVVGLDGTYLIDPVNRGDLDNYMVYYKNDFPAARGSFHCSADELISKEKSSAPQPGAENFSRGAQLRTYRIAVAATGEYTLAIGSQVLAFADVTNAVNRINTVYRRDLSIQLQLVSGIGLVYPDPLTDPYMNMDTTAELTANQVNIDAVIGNANYDIGHLFGTGGGGIAASPVVCETGFKAQGYSARVPPTGDPFWVDYVAHEIGHQFSGNHTYNTLEGGVCSTRSIANAFEVASGTTIMSYVGICDARNLQQFTYDNFHARSLFQIDADLTAGSSSACGTPAVTLNTPPTPNPGAAFSIPALTPFTLVGSATDPDVGQVLTYSWEQYDLAPSASGPNGIPANTYDVDTDGVQRPLFRNYAPSTSGARTFPSLTYILNNDNTPPLTYMGTSPTGAVCEPAVTCATGENMSAINRTLNFRLVVRDNLASSGGIADGAKSVTVVNTGAPFKVTAQDTLIAPNWQAGTMKTVTWNVAGTTAAPINAAFVNILLSTDGGMTFPTTLAANTANDGTEAITVPNSPTTTARLKVEAVGNIFFDISNVNFTITAPTAAAVSVSGRVFSSNGTGLARALVRVTDQLGNVLTARTNSFGYYRFNGIEAGELYTFNVLAKENQFTTQVITVSDNIANLNFVAIP